MGVVSLESRITEYLTGKVARAKSLPMTPANPETTFMITKVSHDGCFLMVSGEDTPRFSYRNIDIIED